MLASLGRKLFPFTFLTATSDKQEHRAARAILVIAAGCLLVACLSWGCAGKDSTAGPGALTGIWPAKRLTFAEILKQLDRLPEGDVAAQLRLLRSAPGTSDEQKREAAYVLARLLQKGNAAGDLKQAVRLLEEASAIAPLWGRCQWHISECGSSLGNEKLVRKSLASIAERSAAIDEVAGARYGLAQSYLRANEKERARQAFADIRRQFPGSQWALGAAYYLGEMALADGGKQNEALACFRQYLKASPDGHFARDIVARLAALPGYTPTSSDRALFAQVHFVHGEWSEALADWSRSAVKGRWLEQATCQAQLKRTAEARQALWSGIKAHPNDPSLPAAADMLSQMSSHDEAVSLWKTILAASSRYGDLALWNLAVRSSPPQSLAYFRQILSRYPQSNYAPESFWWSFWDDVQHGKLKAALSEAAAGQKRYQRSKAAPRLAFWAGKLHERLKEKEAAKTAYRSVQANYPSNYYGWRATARLAALSGGKDEGWRTDPLAKHPNTEWTWPAPPALVSYDYVEKSCGATAATLLRLHQWEESLGQLKEDAPPVVRAFCLAMVNLPLDALEEMKRDLGGSPESAPQWQLAYPLLYGRIIAPVAAAAAVDPLLVHALIREESRYNALALSRSNAIGLMQLLPGTAYGVAKRLGVTLNGTNDIYNPENNLRLGIDYLAYLLRGNRTMAGPAETALLGIASYNGGPNAARQWVARMRQQGASDWDQFVENISLKETRDYVRKVFASYWNYRLIYKS